MLIFKIKAIDLIMKDTSLPNKVAKNTKQFRDGMKSLGFNVIVSINC